MNDRDRRRYEAVARVAQFGVDNAADFSGFIAGKFSEIAAKSTEIETIAGTKESEFGEFGQAFEQKATARENLREDMAAIARTARAMEYQFDGISDLFQYRRNLPDAQLLARARAFFDDSAAYESDFVDYGLSATFRDELKNAADAFEASMDTGATATAERVAATADVSARVAEGMQLIRVLDAPVRNVYAGNVGKLAAWISAKTVEKDPKKTTPPPGP